MKAIDYIRREIESVLLEAISQFPAVAVTGSRQSGKSTLLRQVLSSWSYVTLDDPLVRQQAIRDPQMLLDTVGEPLIIDEFQYAPDLLHYLKMRIDQDRALKGRFVLTGSQQFQATKGLSESLAGRIALLELTPFSLFEIQHSISFPDSCDLFVTNSLRGMYPELVADQTMDASLWCASYLQTYIDRDIRALYDIGNLRDFERVLQLLAAHCSQQLNLSSISRDVGVAVNTVKKWVSILESCGMIYLLPAYSRNLGLRVVKAPKVYFVDSGLVCYLTGLRDRKHLMEGPMAGALFENLCVQEALKSSLSSGRVPRMSYLRTQNGLEIDLIIESANGTLIPFEFKLSRTPKISMTQPLERFVTELEPDSSRAGALVCLTEADIQLTRNVHAMSLNRFVDRLRTLEEES